MGQGRIGIESTKNERDTPSACCTGNCQPLRINAQCLNQGQLDITAQATISSFTLLPNITGKSTKTDRRSSALKPEIGGLAKVPAERGSVWWRAHDEIGKAGDWDRGEAKKRLKRRITPCRGCSGGSNIQIVRARDVVTS
jgi:hypothetical protein